MGRMKISDQPRLRGTALFWTGVVLSGFVGKWLGPAFAIRSASMLSPLAHYWSLSLLVFQVLTAMICFLVLYRALALGVVARVVAKRGVEIESQSTLRGMLLSTLIPLVIWAIGMALMMDLARSGMHDSM